MIHPSGEDGPVALLWAATVNGTLSYVHPQFADVFGVPVDRLLDQGWEVLVHPDELLPAGAFAAQALRNEAPFVLDIRLRTERGGHRWFRISASPQRNARNEFRGFTGVALDVDDLITARALATDRERAFRLVADTLPQIAWSANRDGYIDWFNARWFEYTGILEDNSIGWGWRSAYHPLDVEEILKRWPRSLETGDTFEMELRLRGADGVYRWFLTRAEPLLQDDGTVIRWYGTSTDIDEPHRERAQLAELLEREKRFIKRLQHAFLPAAFPTVEGVRFDAIYRPAMREAHVGGDWYDVFVIPDGRIGISIGDVAGHGLDAATAMVRTREALRAASALQPDRPDLVLQRVDRAVANAGDLVFATALFGVLDPATGEFIYSGAGHNPPVITAPNAPPAFLADGGVPLGLGAAMEPANLRRAMVSFGGSLVFYTDGLVEAERDLLDGEIRLLATIADRAHTADEIVHAMVHGAQVDDVAVLVISLDERAPIVRDTWRFVSDDAFSAHGARSSFVTYLRGRGMEPRAIEVAELVFGELIGNVVLHAPGRIDVRVEWNGAEPMLIVRDEGDTFDPPDALPENMLAEGGRGLYLIGAFASAPVVIAVPGGGKEVAVRLPHDAVEAPRRNEDDAAPKRTPRGC